MTWFNKLSSPFKTALLSTLVVVIVFLGFIFGYFTDQPDLPNGILAGGLLGSISYLLLGIAEMIDEKKQLPVWTIIFTVLRFILIAALVVVSALLQFKLGYKVMNVFTVVGGYAISLIIYIVISLLEKKHV